MKIGIDARMTYYRRGGISTYITQLSAALATLDTVNQYTLFHSRKSRDTLVTRFRRASLWTPSHHRLERLTLSLELLPFNLNIFHATDFIPPIYGARHHIATVYDLTFLHYPDFLTDESRRYYNDQIEYAVRHADHILTISESSRKDIMAMLGVPSEKITVHLLGVDDSFQPLSAAQMASYRQALALPDQYFLFVGTFEPRKNLIGLAHAYRALLDQYPNAPPLLIVGSQGWNFEDTQQQMNQLAMGEHVQWRENVPQDALVALYNGALALILPSFYEGFGFPALEAMACGTPTIVSNSSSLPEVVGTVGALILPDEPATITEAMLRAWQDESWRTAQGEAGKIRAKTFTWDKTAQITLSVYRSFS